MALTKVERRIRIKRRIRKVIFGTAERPRLSVYRSNTQISAQLIDDNAGKTLVSASSLCKEIAEKKIRQEGYDYPVTVSLGTTYFPVKEYGDMAFPAGDYEALRVQIGESKGRNWWCVMYPSLCLVDGVYQTVPESSKDKLKQVLSTSEYQSLVDGGEDVQFRLRFFDWLF